MKILALILTALLTLATGASVSRPRTFEAVITFSGAASEFTYWVPTDGSVFWLENQQSISQITSLGGAKCEFQGVDGSQTMLVGSQTVDVGPPQTILTGFCVAL